MSLSQLPEVLGQALSALAREIAKELAPALSAALAASPPGGLPSGRDEERYLTVTEACKHFQISRATFDRVLSDPSSGLEDVVVRLPPATGRVKVPLRAFEAWLQGRRQRKRRGRSETR